MGIGSKLERVKEKGMQKLPKHNVLTRLLFSNLLRVSGYLSLLGKKKSQIRILIPFHTNDGSNGMEQLFRLKNKLGTFKGSLVGAQDSTKRQWAEWLKW